MNGDDDEPEIVDILLVEPNDGDSRLFAENFQDGKIANDLHRVSDAERAIDYLCQRGEYADVSLPDLVLLEPRLPGKSVDDLLGELDDVTGERDVPVVILTGTATEEAIVRARDLEADHYVQKPVEPEDFVEFVEEIEEFWLALTKQPAD